MQIKRPAVGLAILFYLYIFSGFFFSNNFSTALSSLSLYLPYLLIPLFIGSAGYLDEKTSSLCFRLFVFSLSLSLLAAVTFAIYDIYRTGTDKVMIEGAYYSKLSSFGLTRVFKDWHPTYVSAFCNFSIAIIVNSSSGARLPGRKNMLNFMLFVFLSLCIFLLNSIAGIITYCCLLIFFGFQWLRKYRLPVIARLSIFIVAAGLVTAFLFINPLHLEKIETFRQRGLKITDREGERNVLTIRMAKWITHYDIFKKNPLWGATAGDIADAREKAYENRGYHDLAKHNYNAHNQYIEVLSVWGIAGFIIFILLLLTPLFTRPRNALLFPFILVSLIVFCSESILERQQGLFFFMFFYSILTHSSLVKNPGPVLKPKKIITGIAVLTILLFVFLYIAGMKSKRVSGIHDSGARPDPSQNLIKNHDFSAPDPLTHLPTCWKMREVYGYREMFTISSQGIRMERNAEGEHFLYQGFKVKPHTFYRASASIDYKINDHLPGGIYVADPSMKQTLGMVERKNTTGKEEVAFVFDSENNDSLNLMIGFLRGMNATMIFRDVVVQETGKENMNFISVNGSVFAKELDLSFSQSGYDTSIERLCLYTNQILLSKYKSLSYLPEADSLSKVMNPDAYPYLYEYLKQRGQKAFYSSYCQVSSLSLANILEKDFNIPVRQIHMQKAGIGIHQFIEYWNPYKKKWIVIDPSYGVKYKKPQLGYMSIKEIVMNRDSVNSYIELLDLFPYYNYKDTDPGRNLYHIWSSVDSVIVSDNAFLSYPF